MKIFEKRFVILTIFGSSKIRWQNFSFNFARTAARHSNFGHRTGHYKVRMLRSEFSNYQNSKTEQNSMLDKISS